MAMRCEPWQQITKWMKEFQKHGIENDYEGWRGLSEPFFLSLERINSEQNPMIAGEL